MTDLARNASASIVAVANLRYCNEQQRRALPLQNGSQITGILQSVGVTKARRHLLQGAFFGSTHSCPAPVDAQTASAQVSFKALAVPTLRAPMSA